MNKKILFLTLLAIIATASTPKQSDTRVPVSASKERIRLQVPQKHEASRLKCPSRQRIEVLYDGEYLEFDFAYPEGECEVTLTEYVTFDETTYVIDSSDCHAEVYVGALYESTVTLTTESGTTYTCELTSE